MPSIRLPVYYEATERGNVLIERDGAYAAWLRLPTADDGRPRRLEVALTPGNYPCLHVSVLAPESSTDQALAGHVRTKVKDDGWQVLKYNLDGPAPVQAEVSPKPGADGGPTGGGSRAPCSAWRRMPGRCCDARRDEATPR